MIVDTVIVEIPIIREETVLAILSALQAYERNAYEKKASFYKTKIGENFKLVLLIVRLDLDARFDYIFIKCLNHLQGIHASMSSAVHDVLETTKEITSVVSLSEPVAKDLAQCSNKHLAQTFGIILGSEASSLPDVSKLEPATYDVKNNWLLISSPIAASLLVDAPINPISVFVDIDTFDRTLEARIELSFMSAAYAGRLSFESYLMSALKKPVFEVSDELYMFKWSNPNYFHTLATPHNEQALKKGLHLCLNRLELGE